MYLGSVVPPNCQKKSKLKTNSSRWKIYFLAQLENMQMDSNRLLKVPFKQKTLFKCQTDACGIKKKKICMFYIQIICTHHQ